MKKRKLGFMLLSVSALLVSLFLFNGTQAASIRNYIYKISCSQVAHDTYGLTYPVTYVFTSTTAKTTDLFMYKRYSILDVWQKIPQYYSNEFFNGVEAVRFDYVQRKAFVSIAFSSETNDIYLKLTDRAGNNVDLVYLGIAEYYDNRKCAVTVTIDDVQNNPPAGSYEQFLQATRMFANAQVYWTAGIITRGGYAVSNWTVYQTGLNMGYCEVASHSCDHPDNGIEYQMRGYDFEIGTSKQDVIGHLDLPWKKGIKEYVWSYLNPSGYSDDVIMATLNKYQYLVSRTVTPWPISVPMPWANWNATYNHYSKSGTGPLLEGYSLTAMNGMFDSVRASGGIYHPWGHLGQNSWVPTGKAYQHIQYIKGHVDVWYVSFGLLYLYHHTQRIVQVQILS